MVRPQYIALRLSFAPEYLKLTNVSVYIYTNRSVLRRGQQWLSGKVFWDICTSIFHTSRYSHCLCIKCFFLLIRFSGFVVSERSFVYSLSIGCLLVHAALNECAFIYSFTHAHKHHEHSALCKLELLCALDYTCRMSLPMAKVVLLVV